MPKVGFVASGGPTTIFQAPIISPRSRLASHVTYPQMEKKKQEKTSSPDPKVAE
jgi:hypothetical protein